MRFENPLKRVERLKRVRTCREQAPMTGCPPVNSLTEKFPVLHYGSVPVYRRFEQLGFSRLRPG